MQLKLTRPNYVNFNAIKVKHVQKNYHLQMESSFPLLGFIHYCINLNAIKVNTSKKLTRPNGLIFSIIRLYTILH